MGNKREKIAIINLTRMGDLLMTAPMIAHLRKKNPQAEIHLFAVTSYLPIAKGLDVDKVYDVPFSRLTELSLETTREHPKISLLTATNEMKKHLNKLRTETYSAIYNCQLY